MADYTTLFGRLRIPIKTFVDGCYGFYDVVVEHRIDPKTMKYVSAEDRWLYDPQNDERVPADIRAYMAGRIEKERKAAAESGRIFFDGQHVRMRGYRIEIKDNDPEERHRLCIWTAPTSFFLNTVTNLTLDDKVLSDGEGTPVSIRKKYNPDIDVMDDFLGNSTGGNLVLVSKPDHELVYVRRSSKLRQYPDMFGAGIAGFMNREKDVVAGAPNPFVTWQREGQEEMGVECPPDYMALLHIGRAGDDLHGEISGIGRTPMTVSQILGAPKKTKYESLEILHVPFEPKPVLRVVAVGRKNDAHIPHWVPAHAFATIQALYTEYKPDEVMAAMEETERELGL